MNKKAKKKTKKTPHPPVLCCKNNKEDFANVLWHAKFTQHHCYTWRIRVVQWETPNFDRSLFLAAHFNADKAAMWLIQKY